MVSVQPCLASSTVRARPSPAEAPVISTCGMSPVLNLK
jgi:hypothetical protein